MSQSNIFEAGAVEVTELFADYLEGSVAPGSCIALVLSGQAPGKAARNAIQKSLAALGFGAGACSYACLAPATGEDVALDAQALFLLVEGLDPLCIVAADARASELLAAAYRQPVPRDSAVRLLGRPSVAFADLDALLSNDAGKQKAWALFKTFK